MILNVNKFDYTKGLYYRHTMYRHETSEKNKVYYNLFRSI